MANGNEWPSDQEVVAAVAPSQLNQYACALEDSLDAHVRSLTESQQFVGYQHQVIEQLRPHLERYKAMEILLTTPDLLAAYVQDLFTQVYPVQTETNQQLERQGFPEMPSGQTNNSNISLSDIRPDQRWLVADQMEEAGLFSGKQLVVE